MITMSEITELENRFLSRDQLEKIQIRAQRIPTGAPVIDNDVVSYNIYNEKGKLVKTLPIVKVIHPGCVESFANYKKDIESLITHVLKADKENDLLLERVRQLENAT
jgi:hypothetical protein